MTARVTPSLPGRPARTWLTAAALLVAAVVGVACGSGAIETAEVSFAVGASPRLVVGAGNGDLLVRAGPDGTVTVVSGVTRPENVELDTTAAGDVVTVSSSTMTSGNLLGDVAEGRVDFTITVPANTRVEAGITTGAVEIVGLRADGRVTAAAGGITLTGVTGEFSGGIGAGPVTITGSSGAFRFTSGSGDITFDGRLAAGGLNELETGAGTISVRLPGDASVAIDASVSVGTISNEFGLPVRVDGTGAALSGTLGGGSARLALDAGTGTINIRVATPAVVP